MDLVDFNGYNLSRLALGTVQFGLDYGIANKFGKVSQKNVNEILDFVQSVGINTFDTAQVYGDSEAVLGNYLNNTKFQSFLISKLKSEDILLDNSLLVSAINQSLNRLNVDFLFGLLSHDPKILNYWSDEIDNKVSLLKNLKLIKYFGVSIYECEDFEKAVNIEGIDLIQIPFNIFDQRALKEKWFEKAKCKNKLIFVRSVYLQGLLLMDYQKLPQSISYIKPYLIEFGEYSKRVGLNKNIISMGFVSHYATSALVLFGCDTIQQAKENVENYLNSLQIPVKVLDELTTMFTGIEERVWDPRKWPINKKK